MKLLTEDCYQIGAFFPWYPLFSHPAAPNQQADSLPGNLPSATAVELPDLQYERACVLLNISATYARMAIQEDRNSVEGMKKAIAYFCVRLYSAFISFATALTDIVTSTARRWHPVLRSRYSPTINSALKLRSRSSFT
jgi:hypothetical protein